jgi:hypothetical protein
VHRRADRLERDDVIHHAHYEGPAEHKHLIWIDAARPLFP